MTAALRCIATVVLGSVLWLTVLWPALRAHASDKLFTLSEAFRLALRNNESFGITEEGVRRVRLAYDKALALLLPTLRVEGTYTFFDTELAFDFGNRRVVLQQKSQFGGLGTFTMSLFDARALPGLRQTKIQAKASEESTAFTQADLLFEVSRTFVSVLAAQRLVEVNRNAVIVAEEHLRDARAQAKAGTALRLAVTRAEIEVVKAQREHTRAQNGLEAAWVALRYLVGAPVRGALARPAPPSLGSRAVAELVVEAQRSRRDLRAAAMEIESARKGLEVAYGSFYPSLGLLASSRATPATGLANRVLNSQTVFTLGWTIFDGGVRYAELKEKHSLLREATLKHQQLTRQIEREVRTARLELDTAEAALVTSRRELDLARENHGMVMARFRAGLATTIEAVDASTQLATAEVSVLREELNVDTMRINLLRATGVDPLAALNGGENPAPKSALRVPNWDAPGAAGVRSSR